MEEYKGFTIQHDTRYKNQAEFMFYVTEDGVDHDMDYTGEGWKYVGNCRWAETIESAKLQIDGFINELVVKSMIQCTSKDYIIRGEYHRALKEMPYDKLRAEYCKPSREERIAQNRAKVDLTKRYDSSTWRNV